MPIANFLSAEDEYVGVLSLIPTDDLGKTVIDVEIIEQLSVGEYLTGNAATRGSNEEGSIPHRGWGQVVDVPPGQGSATIVVRSATGTVGNVPYR